MAALRPSRPSRRRSRFAGSGHLAGDVRFLRQPGQRGGNRNNPNQINEAFLRLIRSDVRFRFVIDMATL
jgi:hypothetical protein